GGIGLVEIDSVPIPIYLDMVKEFGPESVRDASDIFKQARFPQNEVEIECSRKAAKVADDIFMYLKSNLCSGMTDQQLFGQIRQMIYEGGCEYSMEIIDCGDTTMYAPIGSVLAEGSMLHIELTPAYAGYYNQLTVYIPTSPYSASMRKALSIWEKGFQAAVEALRPGAKACDVYQAAANEIRSYGYELGASVGHGLGLDVYEYIGVGPDNETVLEPGMVLVIHFGIQGEGETVGGQGKTYLVTKDGQEALNKVDII
ncbi:M24 family metallopeptidase, partial [Chloroflexota bacterium]